MNMFAILKYIVGVQFLLLLGGPLVSGFISTVRVKTLALPKISNSSSSSYQFEYDHQAEERIYRSKVRQNTRTAYDVIKQLGATEFLKLASASHFDSILKNPNANITVFVPSNSAMMAVSPDITSNLTCMNMIIRFHIASGLVQLSDIHQNGMLETLAKWGQNTAKYRLQIRTNIYKIKNSTIVSVNGAKIVQPDQNGNGTIVHLVDKALYPLPLECAYYTIFHHQAFSILKTFLESSITLLRVLCDMERSLTFFAPTDEAFKKLPADVFKKFKNDVPLLTKVFVQHIATNVYYSVGILANHTVKGVAHNKISLRKKQNGILVTTNKVTGNLSIPDISVLNGIIHGIDTVLYRPNSGVEIIG